MFGCCSILRAAGPRGGVPVRECPILFSAPMVRAILDGRKTQTRRVAKPFSRGTISRILDEGHTFCDDLGSGPVDQHSPYGLPGDLLWVKEAAWVWCRKVPNGKTTAGRQKFKYRPYAPHMTGHVLYVADHPGKPERSEIAEPDMVWRYKTARYMPKNLCRITLEITDVRVQRLQDISEEDAVAEGAMADEMTSQDVTDIQISDSSPIVKQLAAAFGPGTFTAKFGFSQLWDSINAKTHPWSSNPFVWAVGFKRVKP